MDKIAWSGRIVSVQPRIRLLRSFDQTHHGYHGYVLCVDGECGEITGEFTLAVGKGAQEKHRFCVGMEVSGLSLPVEDPRLEVAGFYKVSRISIDKANESTIPHGPPFPGVPPDLLTYRERAHRRLSAKTFSTKCTACIWGSMMPVEITIDHWNSSNKKYRFESFCYGPKSCSFYKAGPIRKVPGRNGMVWEEEDWIEEEATSHRGPDD